MEVAIVIGLFLLCATFAGRQVLRNLGVGMRDNKPDCGCGKCDEKRNRRSR